MRTATLVIGLVALQMSTTLAAQTIYYEVSEGDHYEKGTWYSASLKRFKIETESKSIFDSYTFKRRADGTSVVERNCDSPSRDWLLRLKYLYGTTGRLRYVRWNLFTFSGTPEGEGITNCLQTFTVNSRGGLRQTSERTTDNKTGKVVDRSFHAPQVKHWMNLKELPITPET